MKLFEHYVLTRFNIFIHDWAVRFRNHPAFVSRDSWMDERLSLFESYCLPSMQNQSCLDFKWIIAFDESTALKHRRIIDLYPQRFDRIKIVYTTEERFVNDQKRIMGANFKHLITTRLDTDDALHKHAIRSLQNLFDEQIFEFLNFRHGFQYDLKNKQLFVEIGESSPFMTLVEKNTGNLKTVWVEPHQNIHQKYTARQLRDKRYWLQIVHDLNLLNQISSKTSVRLLFHHIRHSPHCALYDLLNPIAFKKRTLLSFGIKGPCT